MTNIVRLLVCIAVLSVCIGAYDETHDKQVRACLMAGASNSVPAETMYRDCVAAYKYMDQQTVDAAHADIADDPKVSAAVLRIYAGAAALELRRTGEGKTLIAQGRTELMFIATHSTNPDIRNRAQVMKACLIDRDPTCLANWKKAMSGG